jgi:hypothetical protein
MAYQWSLPLLGSGLSSIQPLLATSEALEGRLVLSAGILAEGQSVNISVRVSNFLGASTFAFVLFQRLSTESPSISVEKSVTADPVTSVVLNHRVSPLLYLTICDGCTWAEGMIH